MPVPWRFLAALLALPPAVAFWHLEQPRAAHGRGYPSPAAAPSSRQAAGARGTGPGLLPKNPFRRDRRPAPVAYRTGEGAAHPGGEHAAPPPEPPPLRMSGVAWGSAPSAILEGLPGREGGVVVHVGDTLGGVVVVRISRSEVQVRGFDTTWTLEVRQPW